jgi:hypothetical protein
MRQSRVVYSANCELFIWKNLPKKVGAGFCALTWHDVARCWPCTAMCMLLLQPHANPSSQRPFGCLLPTYLAALQATWNGKRDRRAREEEEEGGGEDGEEEAAQKPDSCYLILKSGRQKSADYRQATACMLEAFRCVVCE